MPSGQLIRVEENPVGSELVADHAAGDDLVLLDLTDPFAVGSHVELLGNSYEVVDVTDTTLQLQPPLLTAAEVGDHVVATEGGRWLTELEAWVVISEGDDPVIATVDFALRDAVPQGTEDDVYATPWTVTLTSDLATLVTVHQRAPVRDLSGADPTTIPEAEALEPPTEAVTVTAGGDATGITAVARGTFAGTTRLDWYLDGQLLEAGTRQGIYRVETTPGGTPLAQDTDYVITVQLSNNAGTGATSDPTTARLNPAVDPQVIRAVIAAGVVFTGALEMPPFLSITPARGLVATHDDGTETRVPADGSGPHFAGTADFDRANVRRLRLYDEPSDIETAARLAYGVVAPTGRPRVTESWNHPAAALQLLRDGAPLDTRYARGLHHVDGQWAFADATPSACAVGVFAANGDQQIWKRLPARFTPSGGVAKIGTSWYVLGQDAARSNGWYLYVYDEALDAKTGEVLVAPSAEFNGMPALASDGTSLYLAWKQNDGPSAGKLFVARYTAGWVQIRRDVVDTSTSFTSAIRGLYVGTTDFGVSRIVLAHSAGVRVYTTAAPTANYPATLARVPANDWVAAGGLSLLGLAWDGTRFRSLGTDGKVWQYARRPAVETRTYASTYFDSDDALPDGQHETDLGEATTYTARARTWVRVEVDAPNDGGGVNDPDSVRVYVDDHRQLEMEPGAATGIYEVFDLTAAGPPPDNQFEDLEQSIGSLESRRGDEQGPYSYVDGNGKERHAKWSQTGRASVTPTGPNEPTTVHVTFPVPFEEVPNVQVTPRTGVPGTVVTGWSAINETLTGFDLVVTRTNTTPTSVTWDAQVPS